MKQQWKEFEKIMNSIAQNHDSNMEIQNNRFSKLEEQVIVLKDSIIALTTQNSQQINMSIAISRIVILLLKYHADSISKTSGESSEIIFQKIIADSGLSSFVKELLTK